MVSTKKQKHKLYSNASKHGQMRLKYVLEVHEIRVFAETVEN